MPVVVKHSKISMMMDDPNTDLVRPSDWNADHALEGVGTMAEQNVNNVDVTGGKVSNVTLHEKHVAIPASNLDLASANFFSKTITGATTFTLSNVPESGIAASFILDLTNGGSAAITWWSNIKWAKGTVPTFTAAGRDVLGFFTTDGGATWTGLLLGKDVK